MLALAALCLVFCLTAEAFAPRGLGRVLTPTTLVVRSPLFSFTPGPGDKEKRITRSIDQEGEFFESEFDRQPIKDRLPLALGVLAGVSLPFIIGLIYLYTNK
jgi:hypothetical protein